MICFTDETCKSMSYSSFPSMKDTYLSNVDSLRHAVYDYINYIMARDTNADSDDDKYIKHIDDALDKMESFASNISDTLVLRDTTRFPLRDEVNDSLVITDKDISVARQCVDRLVWNSKLNSCDLTKDEAVNLCNLFYLAYPDATDSINKGE